MPTPRPLRPLGLLLTAMLAVPATVIAAEGYDSCSAFIESLPVVLTRPGVYCLRKNLNTPMTAGPAIDIQASNITVDCHGFKIGGLAAGAATAALGVRANQASNATLRHCTVRGFYIGVLMPGGGHVIEDNRVEANTFFGMDVAGSGTVVRRNVVLDTGGSTIATGYAVGIRVSGPAEILDNAVSGVAGTANAFGNAHAYGISTDALQGSITGNRVRGLVRLGTGSTYGINNQNNHRLMLRNNDVEGPGSPGFAIYCTLATGAAMGNAVSGFGFSIHGCRAQNNLPIPPI